MSKDKAASPKHIPHPKLPIDVIESEFKQIIIEDNVVVEAETGSGKSTRLPLWAQSYGRVLVVQPRRIACTSLAKFLAEQANESIGESIGYAVKFEAHYSDQTKTVFVTPGVALRWYSENQLNHFDAIIIDEMHLRRWDTDLLMAMVVERQQQDRLKQHPLQHRLILTSATLNSRRLAEHINGRTLKAAGRRFHVEVFNDAKEARFGPDSRDLEQRVLNALLSCRFDDPDNATEGDVLVFLPGRKEIQLCQSKLKSIDAEVDADIIPLHASVSDEDRQRALTHNPSRRRVILATNVAETSLTIPGVTLIIDSGLERRTHQRNGRTVLSLHSISKASAEQRKGRAGRIKDGLCIRLYGADAPLESVTPPDLLREELTEPMLAAACCGYRLAELPLLEPLPEKTFLKAQQQLLSMQAIDIEGVVTDHGKMLYPLPIDPLFAHLITVMKTRAEKEAMVDLASALSVPQRLYSLPRSEEALSALHLWEPLHCDAMTLIKLVRHHHLDSNHHLGSSETLDAGIHSSIDTPEVNVLEINADSVAEARKNAMQIRDALSLPSLSATSRVPRESWLKHVAEAAPELVFVRRQQRSDSMGNNISEVNPARESRIRDEDIAFVVFDQFHLPGKGKKQTLNLATCCAPIPVSTLVALNFGEVQVGHTLSTISIPTKSASIPTESTTAGLKSPAKSHGEEALYQVVHERIYAGRVIDRQTQSPSGEQLIPAACQLIINNQVLPGLADSRYHDIQQWHLYCELTGTIATSAPPTNEQECSDISLEAWLTAQLTALSLDSLEDLEMFEPSDFPFNGIPEWEREEFDQRYPRILHLADLQLSVEYHPKGKRVTLHYLSGGRKTDPKRWELPHWAGWKMRYKKASRVIDIK